MAVKKTIKKGAAPAKKAATAVKKKAVAVKKGPATVKKKAGVAKTVKKASTTKAGAAAPAKKAPTKKTPAKKKSGGRKQAATPANPFATNGGRVFAEPKPVSDGPWTANDSDSFFSSQYYDKNAVTAIPPLRDNAGVGDPSVVVNLSDIIGEDAVKAITSNGKTVFHAVGDTGAVTSTKFDDDEIPVANMMAADVDDPIEENQAAFLFHLGDVIYQFGDDASFYYEQFYEPYRTYNAPIFAIPGNHDGMIHTANAQPLQPFLNNFCAATPAPSPDAFGLSRDTMTQPGVYFTLDAPLVSIIGLYSNVLENPPGGVISNYQGKYPKITNVQLDFLTAELKRLQALRVANNDIAIIVAVHHPPYAGASGKGGSPMLLADLDAIFTATGVWPDAVLSGHTHHYERFTRNANGREIPYVIAGCGGYNMLPLSPAPAPDLTSTVALNTHALRIYLPVYGYLKISVTGEKLGIAYNSPNTAYGPGADTVVVDLTTHKVISEGKGDPDSLV
jgi:Calcineurin-like phosphoesterase